MPEPNDFGEPISTYTDEDALEDGQIIAVSKRDRITVGVFAFLSEAAPEGHGPPPPNWAVPLLEWCRAKTDDAKAATLANGFIEAHRGHAERADADSRFFVANLTTKNGKLSGYTIDLSKPDEQPATSPAGWRKVWLVPNELHGFTMMFPEEY